MRVQLDDDVDLHNADVDELLEELRHRIETKQLSVEEAMAYLAEDCQTNTGIVTQKDWDKWLVFAGVKREAR